MTDVGAAVLNTSADLGDQFSVHFHRLMVGACGSSFSLRIQYLEFIDKSNFF